jgi:hypothetical protein
MIEAPQPSGSRIPTCNGRAGQPLGDHFGIVHAEVLRDVQTHFERDVLHDFHAPQYASKH